MNSEDGVNIMTWHTFFKKKYNNMTKCTKNKTIFQICHDFISQKANV